MLKSAADDRPAGRCKATVASMNARNAAIPFNAWLGAQVVAAYEDGVKLLIPWRVEFGGAPGMTHGGILASVIDMTAFLALVATRGAAGPTVDMRVDFHRSTVNGTIFALGRVIRSGATISTAEVLIHDAAQRLIASGRCVFLNQSHQRAGEEWPEDQNR